jgi:hypothetical protein
MIDAFASCDPYSWQSTQVYTPFGRVADSRSFFFGFSQVPARFVRKVVGFVKSSNADNPRELVFVPPPNLGTHSPLTHSPDHQIR